MTATYRITPARVLRSEWHKLTTLRSTWIGLGLTVVLTLGTGLLIAASYEGGGGDDDIDTVLMILLGMQFTYVVLGTLGVLTTAGEHSTGQIRATMTAVPATPSRIPPTLFHVILSSRARKAASRMVQNGVVALSTEASPAPMTVWPAKISEKGMTLLITARKNRLGATAMAGRRDTPDRTR